MYITLVVSVLLYGSEAWATTLADLRRLDVFFDMRCQRRPLRVFWQQHIITHTIRERTKQPTASYILRQRRLRWFGHLHRMPSSLPARGVYDFNPNIHGWKRPGAKTIKKNTNSTQYKSQTHRAKQYEVTSFLSTNCELSTETCSKNVYSLGP